MHAKAATAFEAMKAYQAAESATLEDLYAVDLSKLRGTPEWRPFLKRSEALYQIKGGSGSRTYEDAVVLGEALRRFKRTHAVGPVTLVFPCCGLAVMETAFCVDLLESGYALDGVVLMDRCLEYTRPGPALLGDTPVERVLSFDELARAIDSTSGRVVVIGFCAMPFGVEDDAGFDAFVRAAGRRAYPRYVHYRTSALGQSPACLGHEHPVPCGEDRSGAARFELPWDMVGIEKRVRAEK